MLAFGYDELAKLPYAKKGQLIKCPKCGEQHKLDQCINDDGYPSSIMTFECGGKTYLGSVAGKLIL